MPTSPSGQRVLWVSETRPAPEKDVRGTSHPRQHAGGEGMACQIRGPPRGSTSSTLLRRDNDETHPAVGCFPPSPNWKMRSTTSTCTTTQPQAPRVVEGDRCIILAESSAPPMSSTRQVTKPNVSEKKRVKAYIVNRQARSSEIGISG